MRLKRTVSTGRPWVLPGPDLGSFTGSEQANRAAVEGNVACIVIGRMRAFIAVRQCYAFLVQSLRYTRHNVLRYRNEMRYTLIIRAERMSNGARCGAYSVARGRRSSRCITYDAIFARARWSSRVV